MVNAIVVLLTELPTGILLRRPVNRAMEALAEGMEDTVEEQMPIAAKIPRLRSGVKPKVQCNPLATVVGVNI